MEDGIQFEEKDEKSWKKKTKQNIKTIIIIVAKTIIMIAIITKIKLKLLLFKNRK